MIYEDCLLAIESLLLADRLGVHRGIRSVHITSDWRDIVFRYVHDNKVCYNT